MFSVVSNPEFLKEGAAVEDFMRPDRIVIGCDDDDAGRIARARLMKRLYAPFNRNHERTLYMDVRSAEFTKYAANAMLATRISFMNELANLADTRRRRYRSGAPRHRLRSAHRLSLPVCGLRLRRLVLSERRAGADPHGAPNNGHTLRILEAVEAVNDDAEESARAEDRRRASAKTCADRTFAVWGLAFKPNTDDMREAPSRR